MCILPTTTASDFEVMASAFGGVHETTISWLADSVISGFMLQIGELNDRKVLVVTPLEAQSVFQGLDSSSLFSGSHTRADYADWNDLRMVLFPLNLDNAHWVLIILYPLERKIQGIFANDAHYVMNEF